MTPTKPLLPQQYTIDQIDSLAKSMDKGAFGMMMDARVRQIEKYQKLTFVELGYICLKVEQTESWIEMYGGGRFKSFGAWISDAAPSSRATAYAAMGEVRKAIEDGLSMEQLNKLPRCNIKTINRLSTPLKKDPEILKAAETMEERDFKRKIEKEHPNQHVEDDSPYRFKPSKSQRQAIDAGIDAAILLGECSTREEVLEMWATSYLEDHRDELQAEVGEAAHVD